MIARCDGQEVFSLPRRYVRRQDVGRPVGARAFPDAGPGRLRLWVVNGVTADGVQCLARWRRTSEGAVLLCPFGDGIDRDAVRDALRAFAPPGVGVGLERRSGEPAEGA
jgi:hypothetical protein